MLTKAWAEKWFSYDPLTGVVTRKKLHKNCNANGSIDDLGYVRFTVDGIKVRAHNVAWLLMTGEWSAVDHVNMMRADNRFCNLRKADKSQNAANTKARSGLKGVSFCATTRKFRADIRFKGKRMNLGRYSTAEEAKAVYNAKALELFGEYARL